MVIWCSFCFFRLTDVGTKLLEGLTFTDGEQGTESQPDIDDPKELLQQQNEELKRENEERKKKDLEKNSQELKRENQELKKENEDLKRETEGLKRKIAELEASKVFCF